MSKSKAITTLRKVLKGVALFPWWVTVRTLGWHRDHAWRRTDVRTLDLWIKNPINPAALMLGSLFWIVVVGGFLWFSRE